MKLCSILTANEINVAVEYASEKRGKCLRWWFSVRHNFFYWSAEVILWHIETANNQEIGICFDVFQNRISFCFVFQFSDPLFTLFGCMLRGKFRSQYIWAFLSRILSAECARDTLNVNTRTHAGTLMKHTHPNNIRIATCAQIISTLSSWKPY